MLIVKKFGGTSVANKERIYNVANRCVEEYKKGNDVVVVLSAMGKYTDELISMAEDINEKPPKREMDMLFTIGEQMSVSLMAMCMEMPASKELIQNVSAENWKIIRSSLLQDSRESINTMIIQLWEEAVLTRLQLLLQQLFMQMPVKSIQTLMEFIQQIHVKFRRHAS